MSKIGIISNAKSKKNRKHPEIIEGLRYVSGKNAIIKETSDIEELYDAAKEFKEKDIDILAINGGDGTVHVTLSAFINVYKEKPLPKIAILRAGTMNTIATSLNIYGRPEDILLNIVKKHNANTPFITTKRNLLKINEKQYGFIYGSGVIYNFLKIYYQNEDPSPAIAAKLVAKSVIDGLMNRNSPLFQKIEVEIEENGIKWRNKRFLAVGAMTIREIGLGFVVAPRALEDPDKFQFFAIKSGVLGVIKSFPNMLLFRNGLLKNAVEDKILNSVTLTAKKSPIPYTIDGEMYDPVHKLKIEKGPAITLILR